MRNIALVHLELDLFICRKSGVCQTLLLRNVDKISHLSLSFFLRIDGRFQDIIPLKELGKIIVFANILCFKALQRWLIWTYNASFWWAIDKARFKMISCYDKKSGIVISTAFIRRSKFSPNLIIFICGDPFAPGISIDYESTFSELMHTKLKALTVYWSQNLFWFL